VAVGRGVIVGVDVIGVMVALAVGNVAVGVAEVHAEMVMKSRKTIKVFRDIRELYQHEQAAKAQKR
jgi:hypothetical protein